MRITATESDFDAFPLVMHLQRAKALICSERSRSLAILVGLLLYICLPASAAVDCGGASPTCGGHPCTCAHTCAAATCTSGEIAEVQTLLNTLYRGDTLTLESGAVYQFTSANWLDVHALAGGSSGKLTITGSEHAKLPPQGTRISPAYLKIMPTLKGNRPAMIVRGNSTPAEHIRIRGLHFTGPGGYTVTMGGRLKSGSTGAYTGEDGSTSAYQPDDIIFEQNVFSTPDWVSEQDGHMYAACRNYCEIRDNYFFGSLGSTEAQAILLNNYGLGDEHNADPGAGRGQIRILNNTIRDNAGENIMSGGNGPAQYDLGPSGEIAYNYVTNLPERMRKVSWASGLLVFKGRAVREGGGTAAFVAQNWGVTGSTEPTWPASGCVTETDATPDIQWCRVSAWGEPRNLHETKNSNQLIVRKNVYDGAWCCFSSQWQQKVDKISNYPYEKGNPGQCVATYSGTVNVSGTTVTAADGKRLPNIHYPTTAAAVQIRINGVLRYVAAFVSDTQFTLTENLGTLTGATYSMGEVANGANCSGSFFLNDIFEQNIVRRGTQGQIVAQLNNSTRWRMRNFLIRNNLYDDLDLAAWGDSTGQSLGGFISLNNALPGLQFLHNTITGSTTAPRAGIAFSASNGQPVNYGTPIGTLTFTRSLGDTKILSNIWPKASNAGVNGLGPPSGDITTDGDATVKKHLCAGANCPASQWDKNLIFGVDRTKYTTGGTTLNGCPTDTPCAADWDNSSMFESYANRKLNPVIDAKGHDGAEIGARTSALPLIHNFKITTGATKALITYDVSPVNKNIPCVIEVSESPELNWTTPALAASESFPYIADLNPDTYTNPETDAHDRNYRDGTQRMIVLGANSPLTAATRYYFRLMCGGDAVERWGPGEVTYFETLAADSGTDDIALTFVAPTTDDYRIEYGTYSRATDSFSDDETNVACDADEPCQVTATVNNGAVVLFRWKRDSDNATGPITAVLPGGSSEPPFPAPPAAPSLSSPASGATAVALGSSLQWSASTGAVSYDVFLGTSPNPSFAASTTSLVYQPVALAELTTYYWRVVAKNSVGSTTSATWSFVTDDAIDPPIDPPDAPSLTYPGASATDIPVALSLSWAASARATSYDVYFGTTSTPPLLGNTLTTSYAVSGLSNATAYYWRVAAKNSGGSTTSSTRSFTTAASDPCGSAPSAPTLLSPAASATGVDVAALLQWQASACATSYDVYFGTSTGPSLITNVSGTSYDPLLAESTTYYWKIAARNGHGASSPTSERSFTTGTTGPPAGGTFYVNKGAANCTDAGPGTAAQPFCTIAAASSRMQPGNTAIIKTGIYREQITPKLGGTSDTKRITYQGATGEVASVRGSEEWPTWVADGSIYKATIPNTFFASKCGSGPGTPSGGWNPFNQVHAGYAGTGSAVDGYMTYGKDITLGGLYLDDVPLVQALRQTTTSAGAIDYVVGERSEVIANSNTWTSCVNNKHPLRNGGSKACTSGGADGQTVIWANFSSSPAGKRVEVNCRQAVVSPATWNGKNDDAAATAAPTGLNYITIQNLDIRQGASRWSSLQYWGRGMIETNWSHDWKILNNRISDAAGECISMHHPPSFAGWSGGSGGPIGMDGGFFSVGNHTIKDNIIERCGSDGIHANRGGVGSTIENNLIQDINQGGLMGGFETAAIKLHQALDITVKNNVLRRTRSRFTERTPRPSGVTAVHPCIWLDTGAQGSRITGNIMYDCADQTIRLEGLGAGITLIDHNFLIWGPTIGADQDSTSSAETSISIFGAQSIFAHNMISGLNTRIYEGENCSPVYDPHTSDQIGGTRRTHSDGGWLWGNIMVGYGALGKWNLTLNPNPSSSSRCSLTYSGSHSSNHHVDYNVYWDGALKSTASGFDGNSNQGSFDPTLTVVNVQSGGKDVGAKVAFCADATSLNTVSVYRLSGDNAQAGDSTSLVPLNSAVIAQNAGVDQTIETHEGAKITLSTDAAGNARGTTTKAGPFASYTTTAGSCGSKNTYQVTAAGPQ